MKFMRYVLAGLFALGMGCVQAHPIVGPDIGATIFVANGNVISEFDSSGNSLGQISNPAFSFPTLLRADQATRTLLTDINFVGQNGPDLVRIDLQGLPHEGQE